MRTLKGRGQIVHANMFSYLGNPSISFRHRYIGLTVMIVSELTFWSGSSLPKEFNASRAFCNQSGTAWLFEKSGEGFLYRCFEDSGCAGRCAAAYKFCLLGRSGYAYVGSCSFNSDTTSLGRSHVFHDFRGNVIRLSKKNDQPVRMLRSEFERLLFLTVHGMRLQYCSLLLARSR